MSLMDLQGMAYSSASDAPAGAVDSNLSLTSCAGGGGSNLSVSGCSGGSGVSLLGC
ncbi:MAG: SapB/AmfS family lanthipeptide [Pseudonocardiaceae bacterium]